MGRLVAGRLRFLYVDEQVIERAAERGEIEVERVADEERRKPIFAGLLDYLAESAASNATAPVPVGADEPPSEAVRAFIREAIRAVAEHGNAVIVAHAASFAVGSQRHALRVLITAPQKTRAQRLATADGIGEQEAAKSVRRSDGNRIDYLKRFYGVAQELPTHYDFVINTEKVSLEQAADLIVRLVDQPVPRAD